MVRTKLAAAILGAGMLFPGLAAALGVGDYTLKSYLNQPLDLEIELIQTQDLSPEEVLAALASQDEFARAGVDRSFFLMDVRFEVQQRNGRMYVVAKSRQPVNEPFLNFLLEVQWPQGRMLREYTILLDPPVYKVGAAPAATTQPVVEEAPVPAPRAPAPVEVAPVSDTSGLPPPPSVAAGRPAQPPKPVAASPAGLDAGAGEYRVQAGDTMSEIAARHRPEGVSVQQTIIAIQRANPDAFIDGNVNLVRRGKVLRMPTQDEVARVSASDARAAMADQNRAWRELLDRRGLALPSDRAQLESRKAAPAAGPEKKATGAGEVTLVAPKAAVGKGAASSGKDAEALRTKLTAAEEELSRSARENKELSSRLTDLDKQIKSGEKLLSLKNSEISELQDELNRLRKEKGLPPVEAPAKPEVADTKEPAAPAAEPAVAAADEKPKAKPKPEKKKEEKKAAAEKPAPAQKGPSFLLPLVGALAALGIGGGAFWYLRRRRQAGAEGAGQAMVEESHDAQIAEDLAQLDDLHVGGGEEPGLDQDFFGEAPAAPESESTDPLGEADMYMAYGRFQQAADILYAALQRESNRDDLRVKLAEVYAEMGDSAAAQEHASKAADSRDAGIRAQAAAVLARVGGATAVAVPAAAAAEEPSLDDLALEFSGGQQAPSASEAMDDFSLDMDNATVAQAPVTVDEELEFSLDDFAAPSSEQAAAPVEAAEEFSLEDADLGDFTLQDETTASAPVNASEPPAYSLEDDLSLELGGAADGAPAAMELSDELTDFGAGEEVVAEAVVAEEPAAAGDLDLESELADLEADLSAEGVGSETAAGGDDFDFLADSDENATKLDLARAYIEMGDAEGARDILNEVVADGTADQKMEARSLLEQVG
ncbi:MAG: FimV/HubP family polar landmark protein [Gammaproteobacteria bacterium]